MLKELLKPIISEAYEEGYKKGAEDVVHRMAFVYDVCREKGREDGMTDAGAIDIPEISAEEFDAVKDDLVGI